MKIINNNCNQIFDANLDGMVVINGKVIPHAESITMKDGKIIIDGKTVQECSDNVSIKIEITGSVKYIKTTSGDVTVKGNVTNVKTMSGSVHCQTVEGNVSTMSGSVTCDNIEGNCSTMSGSIMK